MDKIQIKALTYTIVTVIGCIGALILLCWRPDLFCGILAIGALIALFGFFVSEVYKGYLNSFREKK